MTASHKAAEDTEKHTREGSPFTKALLNKLQKTKKNYFVVPLGRTLKRAIAAQVDMDHRALEGCFKIIYECLKQKWPHHTSYEPIILLMRVIAVLILMV